MDETKRKYILRFEGTETEPRYFDELNGNKTAAGISPLIQLVKIERDSDEKTWSNPQKLLDRILQLLNEPVSGITYGTLINAMIDCLYESEWLKKRGTYIYEFEDMLRAFYMNTLKKHSDETVIDEQEAVRTAIDYFKGERPRICSLILEHFSESLEERKITYDPEIDKVCLIVDRDSKSFIERQYDYVLSTCRENGFRFYVSNPCFEFWLLLHFDIVLTLDCTKLLANKPISVSNSAKTYIEDQLGKYLGSYKKSSYRTDCLIEKIDNAVRNEKHFCEDTDRLRTELGSNIGRLISEMKL